MNENTSNNPLMKYFRQPAIYLKLPSEGRFWPPGALELPASGQIPVYPLTIRDEIILRTPDALLNGEGVVEVIQSCCPSIKDAWKMPSVDVDAVLIAIRIASYGASYEQDTKCPYCKEENTHSVDLSPILDNIVCPTYGKLLVKGLSFKIKPQQFFGVNRGNQIEFEEEKIRQALALPDTESELKSKELTRSIERLINLGIETVTDSVEHIELPDGSVVTDSQHIFDFLQQAESAFITELKTQLGEISKQSKLPPVDVVCGHCEKEYVIPLVFDYSNFFGVGS